MNVTAQAKKPTVVVGTPKLRIAYKGTSKTKKVRVLAQLIDKRTDTVVGNQITPFALRLNGKKQKAGVPLEAITFAMRKGQKLTLQIVAQSSAYNTFPKGGKVRFSKIKVSLPAVD